MEKYQEEEEIREPENEPGDPDHHHQLPEEKMAELIRVREELHKAKDNAMQSWLDSKPLIDELEKLQSNLATAKNRISMSHVMISELESQIKIADAETGLIMESEEKAKKVINEITEAIERKYKEAEALKLDSEEEMKIRLKTKQIFKVSRLKLRALQINLRAVSIEIEAVKESEAEARKNMKNLLSEMENCIVRLQHQEYYELSKKAKEETELAKWRISISMQQKFAAEESRNFALSRLKEIERKKNNCSNKEEKISEEEEQIAEEKELQMMNFNYSGNEFPTTGAEAGKARKLRKGKLPRKIKKKKVSIFSRIRRFLVRIVWRLFG